MAAAVQQAMSTVSASLASRNAAPKSAGKGLALRSVLGVRPAQLASVAPQARRIAAMTVECSDKSQVVYSIKAFAKKASDKGMVPLSVFAMNVIAALPAHAEAGKIFDFNLTLPIIVAEFLTLMIVFDNFWVKPVSKVLDERDEMLRNKVGAVKDNSAELQKISDDAAAVLKNARLQAAKIVSDMKKKTQEKLDAEMAAARAKTEKELAAALANLEKEKQKSLANLDEKVLTLSESILAKVLPADTGSD
eukprot:jgi/Mesvir1/6106/Mv00817-RA.1